MALLYTLLWEEGIVIGNTNPSRVDGNMNRYVQVPSTHPQISFRETKFSADFQHVWMWFLRPTGWTPSEFRIIHKGFRAALNRFQYQRLLKDIREKKSMKRNTNEPHWALKMREEDQSNPTVHLTCRDAGQTNRAVNGQTSISLPGRQRQKYKKDRLWMQLQSRKLEWRKGWITGRTKSQEGVQSVYAPSVNVFYFTVMQMTVSFMWLCGDPDSAHSTVFSSTMHHLCVVQQLYFSWNGPDQLTRATRVAVVQGESDQPLSGTWRVQFLPCPTTSKCP